jgi:FlaA1/EpsC-like NDP-sugar epimerase
MKPIHYAAALGVSFMCARRWAAGGKNTAAPSLQGKTVVITGANAGIGFACARTVADLGPDLVIMACRDE